MTGRYDPDREIWRRIPDFEEYAVSSQGRVAHTRFYRLLRDRNGPDGRRKVRLYVKGEWTDKYVHQLMARAFVIGFEWGDHVGHVNGVYWDNRLENLDLKFYHFGYILDPNWDYWET